MERGGSHWRKSFRVQVITALHLRVKVVEMNRRGKFWEQILIIESLRLVSLYAFLGTPNWAKNYCANFLRDVQLPYFHNGT